MPHRIIYSPNRGVIDFSEDHLVVWIGARQFADGRVVDEGDGVNVEVGGDARSMSTAQARELAAQLMEAADELDRWVND